MTERQRPRYRLACRAGGTFGTVLFEHVLKHVLELFRLD
jgi:hypothetical protein